MTRCNTSFVLLSKFIQYGLTHHTILTQGCFDNVVLHRFYFLFLRLNSNISFEVSARVKSLRDLEGPVFNIERAHHFAEIEKGIDKMKSLTGPMYEIERKHNYSEIEKRCEKLEKLEGPVYNTDAVKHQFNEITARIESIKNITYPCVQDDHKHHFNGM